MNRFQLVSWVGVVAAMGAFGLAAPRAGASASCSETCQKFYDGSGICAYESSCSWSGDCVTETGCDRFYDGSGICAHEYHSKTCNEGGGDPSPGCGSTARLTGGAVSAELPAPVIACTTGTPGVRVALQLPFRGNIAHATVYRGDASSIAYKASVVMRQVSPVRAEFTSRELRLDLVRGGAGSQGRISWVLGAGKQLNTTLTCR